MTSFYTTIFLKVRQQERLMQRYTYKQKVTCHHRLSWLKQSEKTYVRMGKAVIQYIYLILRKPWLIYVIELKLTHQRDLAAFSF